MVPELASTRSASRMKLYASLPKSVGMLRIGLAIIVVCIYRLNEWRALLFAAFGCKGNHFPSIFCHSEGKMRDLYAFLTKTERFGALILQKKCIEEFVLQIHDSTSEASIETKVKRNRWLTSGLIEGNKKDKQKARLCIVLILGLSSRWIKRLLRRRAMTKAGLKLCLERA